MEKDAPPSADETDDRREETSEAADERTLALSEKLEPEMEVSCEVMSRLPDLANTLGVEVPYSASRRAGAEDLRRRTTKMITATMTTNATEPMTIPAIGPPPRASGLLEATLRPAPELDGEGPGPPGVGDTAGVGDAAAATSARTNGVKWVVCPHHNVVVVVPSGLV